MAQLTDILGISEVRVQELYKLYSSLAIESKNTSSMIIAIELIQGLQEREKIFLGYVLGRNASQFFEKRMKKVDTSRVNKLKTSGLM